MRWRNYAVLRRFVAAMLWNSAKQYAVFLLVWKFVYSLHRILRVLSYSLFFLYIVADLQELAAKNIFLIEQFSFYIAVSYGISSLLLFLISPGSRILQNFQRYFIVENLAAKQTSQFLRTALLHYKLWLEIPFLSILHLLELLFAISLALLYFALVVTTQFTV